MTKGLNGRILVSGIVLASVVVLAFLALLLAIGDLRGASRNAQRADGIAAAANDLERLVIDLETGERGYIVTGSQEFLGPWTTALEQIPAKEREVRGLLGNPEQQRRELAIAAAIADYSRTWSVPTVTLAERDLAAAVEQIATGAGREKMDRIRALFTEFLAENSRLSAIQRGRASDAGDRAITIGAIGLVGISLLMLVFAEYLRRAVVTPVRQLATASARLGEGDLSARVSEAGGAEVGELARSFNRMAASLEQKQLELTRQNAELDAFSYSVSHDLRAPLRAVDGFSRLLIEDHSAQLDAAGQRYLGLVSKSAAEMGRLIDGLLAFSRLGQQQLNTRRVDVEALARDVVAGLANEDESISSTVTIGPLPDANADPTLVRQVFTNLVENAIKFTRDTEQPKVEIECVPHNGSPAYVVRDNGVGFDMRYADKLFTVFQRLHRVEDYEGTGIGLALVSRIVERHGGTIWAEAELGQGALFFFTLPRPLPQPG